MGRRRLTWCLSMTLSNRYLLDPGSTRPATRLIATRTRPNSNMPRRGCRSAQISGSDCHLIFFFAFLVLASAVTGAVDAAVAIWVLGTWENTRFDAARAKQTTANG